MRALLQRVSKASVTVDGERISQIARGLLVLLGVGHGDTEVEARFLAQKIANLRIFEDSSGKTNLSLMDVGGQAIVVSQFTLYADTSKGRRPSFTGAAPPEFAQPLVERFIGILEAEGVPTQGGAFGQHMRVDIENDGPVTVWLERESEESPPANA